jgi:DHA1 family bicyclomycin/chloramphenicol resistance-like MFS transporter
MTLYAVALGMTLPHAMAMTLEHFPLIAATTSALFGFLQMGLSAVITAGVGVVLSTSPRPMVYTMLGCTILALLLVLRARGAEARRPREPEQAQAQVQEQETPA